MGDCGHGGALHRGGAGAVWAMVGYTLNLGDSGQALARGRY